MISDKEFDEWLQHPVTQVVREYCARSREATRQEWEKTSPTEYLKETFVAGNISNLGYCKAMKEMEELDFQRLIGVIHERE